MSEQQLETGKMDEEKNQSSKNLKSNQDLETKTKKRRRGSARSNKLQQLLKNQQYKEWFKDSLLHFTMIKKNIYLDRKKNQYSSEEDFPCQCIKLENEADYYYSSNRKNVVYNCGDGCMNKLMSTECNNECVCGDLCQNKRFQLHQDSAVYPKPTEGKGWGLVAGEFIPKGQFVCQYIGEVFNINSKIGRERCEEYKDSVCTYMMKTSKNEVIDPTYKGSLARFINHSCDPNCSTQKWQVRGETCIGVFAIKDIEDNQELSFDYGFDSFKTPLTKCLCGAHNCKGYLGQKPTHMTLEEWNDHLDNMPCSICGRNTEDDDDKLLLCDFCNQGFHTFCLSPPLSSIPEDSWFCDVCKEKMKTNQEQDEKKKQQEKIEGLKKKKSKANKIVIMQNDSDDDIDDNFDKDYNERFTLLKYLEEEAFDQLHDITNEDKDKLIGIKLKKKKKTNAEGQEDKKKDKKKSISLKEKEKKKLKKVKKEKIKKKLRKISQIQNEDREEGEALENEEENEFVGLSSKASVNEENNNNRKKLRKLSEKPTKQSLQSITKTSNQTSSGTTSTSSSGSSSSDSSSSDSDDDDDEEEEEEESSHKKDKMDVEQNEEQEEGEEISHQDKKKQLELQKKKQEEMQSQQRRKINRNFELMRMVESQYQDYLKKNEDLLNQLQELGNQDFREPQNQQQQSQSQIQQTPLLSLAKQESSSQQIKKVWMMNRLEIHLLKRNITLFEHMKLRFFWDHSNTTRDLFLKATEVAISGEPAHYELLEKFLNSMSDIVSSLKGQLGIIEAKIVIPALFLKKVIGQSHANLSRLEQEYGVSIAYDKRFVNDVCYSLDQKVSLLLKGQKENIIKAHKDIQELIKTLEVHRIFLTHSETGLVLKYLPYLKRNQHKAEFRLHRESPFKEINHPFYYIPVKEKELTLIGTKEENEATQVEILNIINQNRDREEFRTVNYLLPSYMKKEAYSIKHEIENKVPNLKVMVYEPSLPRKNLTFSIQGTKSNREKAIRILFKIAEDTHDKAASVSYMGTRGYQGQLVTGNFSLEEYQNKMMYQMTKYLLKYMQNTFLTYDTSFMKNWDIITPYLTSDKEFNSDKTTFYDTIKTYILNRDYDTQLYTCFIGKNLELIKRFANMPGNRSSQILSPNLQQQLANNTKLTAKEDVISLIRRICEYLLKMHQDILKHYRTIFDKGTLKDFDKQYYDLKDCHQFIIFYDHPPYNPNNSLSATPVNPSSNQYSSGRPNKFSNSMSNISSNQNRYSNNDNNNNTNSVNYKAASTQSQGRSRGSKFHDSLQPPSFNRGGFSNAPIISGGNNNNNQPTPTDNKYKNSFHSHQHSEHGRSSYIPQQDDSYYQPKEEQYYKGPTPGHTQTGEKKANEDKNQSSHHQFKKDSSEENENSSKFQPHYSNVNYIDEEEYNKIEEQGISEEDDEGDEEGEIVEEKESENISTKQKKEQIQNSNRAIKEAALLIQQQKAQKEQQQQQQQQQNIQITLTNKLNDLDRIEQDIQEAKEKERLEQEEQQKKQEKQQQQQQQLQKPQKLQRQLSIEERSQFIIKQISSSDKFIPIQTQTSVGQNILKSPLPLEKQKLLNKEKKQSKFKDQSEMEVEQEPKTQQQLQLKKQKKQQEQQQILESQKKQQQLKEKQLQQQQQQQQQLLQVKQEQQQQIQKKQQEEINKKEVPKKQERVLTNLEQQMLQHQKLKEQKEQEQQQQQQQIQKEIQQKKEEAQQLIQQQQQKIKQIQKSPTPPPPPLPPTQSSPKINIREQQSPPPPPPPQQQQQQQQQEIKKSPQRQQQQQIKQDQIIEEEEEKSAPQPPLPSEQQNEQNVKQQVQKQIITEKKPEPKVLQQQQQQQQQLQLQQQQLQLLNPPQQPKMQQIQFDDFQDFQSLDNLQFIIVPKQQDELQKESEKQQQQQQQQQQSQQQQQQQPETQEKQQQDKKNKELVDLCDSYETSTSSDDSDSDEGDMEDEDIINNSHSFYSRGSMIMEDEDSMNNYSQSYKRKDMMSGSGGGGMGGYSRGGQDRRGGRGSYKRDNNQGSSYPPLPQHSDDEEGQCSGELEKGLGGSSGPNEYKNKSHDYKNYKRTSSKGFMDRSGGGQGGSNQGGGYMYSHGGGGGGGYRNNRYSQYYPSKGRFSQYEEDQPPLYQKRYSKDYSNNYKDSYKDQPYNSKDNYSGGGGNQGRYGSPPQGNYKFGKRGSQLSKEGPLPPSNLYHSSDNNSDTGGWKSSKAPKISKKNVSRSRSRSQSMESYYNKGSGKYDKLKYSYKDGSSVGGGGYSRGQKLSGSNYGSGYYNDKIEKSYSSKQYSDLPPSKSGGGPLVGVLGPSERESKFSKSGPGDRDSGYNDNYKNYDSSPKSYSNKFYKSNKYSSKEGKRSSKDDYLIKKSFSQNYSSGGGFYPSKSVMGKNKYQFSSYGSGSRKSGVSGSSGGGYYKESSKDYKKQKYSKQSDGNYKNDNQESDQSSSSDSSSYSENSSNNNNNQQKSKSNLHNDASISDPNIKQQNIQQLEPNSKDIDRRSSSKDINNNYKPEKHGKKISSKTKLSSPDNRNMNRNDSNSSSREKDYQSRQQVQQYQRRHQYQNSYQGRYQYQYKRWGDSPGYQKKGLYRYSQGFHGQAGQKSLGNSKYQ